MLPGRGPGDEQIARLRSPTECGMSEYDREASIMRSPRGTGGCCAAEKKSLKSNPDLHGEEPSTTCL